jgi:hypothetical protein
VTIDFDTSPADPPPGGGRSVSAPCDPDWWGWLAVCESVAEAAREYVHCHERNVPRGLLCATFQNLAEEVAGMDAFDGGIEEGEADVAP